METTSQDTTHDLLLALAGRVDDDLLAWARELVAVGEDGHAVEMLTAGLTADRVALPAAVRARLVELARTARIELDADAELAPAGPAERTEHRFAADEVAAGRVAAVLAGLPARQLHDCRVLLTHRRTAAGSAPGPLPHPVLIVEVEPGTRRPDMLSYQLTVALERSGLPASVEVLTVGRTVPAYHAEALRSARPLRLERTGTSSSERAAETKVAVTALPSRRPSAPPERAAEPQRRAPGPVEVPAEPLRLDVTPRARQAGTGRPIAAAAPFGESHSDTPLFDDRSADAAADDRDSDARRAGGRLAAVPSVFDEPDRDGGFDERSADDGAADFHPDEFGRERRGGPAHRAGSPRDDAPPVTPIGRPPAPGPTPIPLLRRGGGGRRPLAPVDSDGPPAGANGSHRDDGFDPLHDPLSRPLMAPLLDPTPPLTGPIGLVGEPEPASPVAEESWSGDWLSGAWAERTPDGAAPDDDRAGEPERPAPRPAVRRAPRHRYLRTPDDPTPDEPEPTGSRSGPIPLPARDAGGAERSAGDSGPTRLPTRDAAARNGGSGAIPMGPGKPGTFDGPAERSGAIPLGPGTPRAFDGPAGRSGAIPMPAGGSADPAGSGAIPMPGGRSEQSGPNPQARPASGAIPMPGGRSEQSGPNPQVPPASGAIPMPGGPAPGTTDRSPRTPTRPAIPMAGGSREPEPRPAARADDRPDVDPALGLRPESLARLGEADLDLFAQLQAELRGDRRPGSEDVETADGAAPDTRPTGPEQSSSGGPGPNESGPNGSAPHGSAPNGSGPNGSRATRSGATGSEPGGSGFSGPGPSGSEPGNPFSGSGPNGSGFNGPGFAGSGANGSEPNGSGPDGSGSDGSGRHGSEPNGPGFSGSGHNGSGFNGSGHNGSALGGSGHHGSGPNGPGFGGSGPSGTESDGFGHNGSGAHEAGPNGTGAYPAAGHRGPNGGPHGTGAYPAPIFGQNGGRAEATGRNPARPPAPPNGTGAHPAVPFGPGPGTPPGAWPPGGPGAPFPGTGFDSSTGGTDYHQVSYQDNQDRRGPEPQNPAPTPPEQEPARNSDRDKRGRNGARHGTGSFRAFGGRRKGRNGRGGPDGGPPDMAG